MGKHVATTRVWLWKWKICWNKSLVFVHSACTYKNYYQRRFHSVSLYYYSFRFTTTVVASRGLELIEPGPPGPMALHLLQRMQWNNTSFDGVELSELQDKQGEREKSADTSGTCSYHMTPGREHKPLTMRPPVPRKYLPSKSFIWNFFQGGGEGGGQKQHMEMQGGGNYSWCYNSVFLSRTNI